MGTAVGSRGFGSGDRTGNPARPIGPYVFCPRGAPFFYEVMFNLALSAEDAADVSLSFILNFKVGVVNFPLGHTSAASPCQEVVCFVFRSFGPAGLGTCPSGSTPFFGLV